MDPAVRRRCSGLQASSALGMQEPQERQIAQTTLHIDENITNEPCVDLWSQF